MRAQLRNSVLLQKWAVWAQNKGLQMTVIRGLVVGMGLVSTIWVSRCLGPYQLGISGVVSVTVACMVGLTNMRLLPDLVRRFRMSGTDQAKLINTIFIFRLFCSLGALVLVGGWIVIVGQWKPDWRLAWMGGALVFMVTVNAGLWVLVARENLLWHYQTQLIHVGFYLLFVYIFIQPGSRAGEDLIIRGLCGGVAWALVWWKVMREYPLTLSKVDWRLLWNVICNAKWLIITGGIFLVWQKLPELFLTATGQYAALGAYRPGLVISTILISFLVIPLRVLYPKQVDLNHLSESTAGRKEQHDIFINGLKWALVGVLVVSLTVPWVYPMAFGAEFSMASWPVTVLLSAKLLGGAGMLLWGSVMARGDYRRCFFILGECLLIFTIPTWVLIAKFHLWGASVSTLLGEMYILLRVYHMEKNIVVRKL
jgi:O-antigen/teichoic acid export membrane protein